MKRIVFAVTLILVALEATSCVTTSVKNVYQQAPVPPRFVPLVEVTVGDFSYNMDGGKTQTSYRKGKKLNNKIMAFWKRKGLIREYTEVHKSAFTGAADYEVTLHGSYAVESSIALQVIAGLSLFAIPYTKKPHFDIKYVVRNKRTGKVFSANLAANYTTIVGWFMLFGWPSAPAVMKKNWDRISTDIYMQLQRQGAF